MQNVTEAPQLKENEISPCALSSFSLLSLQRFEKRQLEWWRWNRWEFDGVAPVVWGLCRDIRVSYGFFITLIIHVSAEIQWFQRSLCLNYCSHIWLELYRLKETKSVASRTCYPRFGSLPSRASLWSGTSPLGDSRWIWGAVDDSHPVEPFYKPFSMPFLFSPRDHRNAAIIPVMI